MLENLSQTDYTVEVYVDNDKMTAHIVMARPDENGSKPAVQQVIQALLDKKVVFGINEKVIKEAIERNRWETKIPAAQGIAPIDGQDARLEYVFQSKTSTQPRIDDSGRVDFYNLGIVNNVRKGDLLVTKIPLRLGTPGTDVYGKTVPAKPPKDVNLPRGKNTVSDSDGIHLFAGTDGHMSFINNKIDINQVFNVIGDVDYSSGNIDFIGSVMIRGNVTTGFRVNAGGDIEVQGSVEGADVSARGSIIVKGGINGKMKGRVVAGGNVAARFIENAMVEAGCNVLAKDAIIQSHIKAGQAIRVTDNKAIIVGGVLQAAEVVECRVLGSQLATQTIVEVGVNPYLKEEYYKLTKAQAAKDKEFKNIAHNLQVYNKGGIAVENLSEKKREILIKLLDQYTSLRNELQEMDNRTQHLEKEMKRYQNAEVKVLDVVYPGVRVTIGDQIYVVNDLVKYVRFIIEDGDIRKAALR